MNATTVAVESLLASMRRCNELLLLLIARRLVISLENETEVLSAVATVDTLIAAIPEMVTLRDTVLETLGRARRLS